MPFMGIPAQKSYPAYIFICLLLVVIGLSSLYLVSIPRIFFDEAVSIEVARNFQLFGVPDIATAPSQFSGVPYITGSSGFPVTAPLAVFFKIFGFGFPQARTYALIWLTSFFIITWFFVKRFWNSSYATTTTALLFGFASLYDSGRRVMGDIPGFGLLLLGLFFVLKKKNKFLGGIFLGLAVAAKPSVYLLIIPALLLTYLIADWRRSLRNLIPIATGMAVPIFSWIILQFPHPLLLSTWQHAFSFYQNAYGSTYSVTTSVIANIKSFASQTTLIYFSIIALATLWSLRAQLLKKDLLALFIVIYGTLDLLYFLKSPGTIRYLLPFQFFILILLPNTIAWLIQHAQARIAFVRKIPFHYVWLAAVTGFSILHIFQFLFSSSVIAKNTAHLETLKFLGSYQTETIGVLSTPHIAAFIPAERKLHYARFTDQIIFGSNPLDLSKEKLPDILVMPRDYEEVFPFTEFQSKNLQNYTLILDGRWKIYKIL